MEHVYLTCTRSATGHCLGCGPDGGKDCRYEVLSECKVCGGAEGSLMPSCPGRWLTREEDDENYRMYCNKPAK